MESMIPKTNSQSPLKMVGFPGSESPFPGVYFSGVMLVSGRVHFWETNISHHWKRNIILLKCLWMGYLSSQKGTFLGNTNKMGLDGISSFISYIYSLENTCSPEK